MFLDRVVHASRERRKAQAQLAPECFFDEFV